MEWNKKWEKYYSGNVRWIYRRKVITTMRYVVKFASSWCENIFRTRSRVVSTTPCDVFGGRLLAINPRFCFVLNLTLHVSDWLPRERAERVRVLQSRSFVALRSAVVEHYLLRSISVTVAIGKLSEIPGYYKYI